MATSTRPVCSRCDAAVDKGDLFESMPRVPDHRPYPKNQGVVWAIGARGRHPDTPPLAGSPRQPSEADQGCHDPEDSPRSRGVRTPTPLSPTAAVALVASRAHRGLED
jgi:hypothetical protein